jgi:superfamily I DNA/RNA helicase
VSGENGQHERGGRSPDHARAHQRGGKKAPDQSRDLREELAADERVPAERGEDREEERRLFYVAITRARKKLFLSYTQLRTIYGAQKVNTPSNFISDIGDEHITSKGDIEEPRGIKAIFIDF